jgi:hypothetical protein
MLRYFNVRSTTLNRAAFIIVVVIVIFETGSPCVDQNGFKLTILQTHPPSSGITGMYHHA